MWEFRETEMFFRKVSDDETIILRTSTIIRIAMLWAVCSKMMKIRCILPIVCADSTAVGLLMGDFNLQKFQPRFTGPSYSQLTISKIYGSSATSQKEHAMLGKKSAWGSSFTLLLLLSTSFTTTVGFVSLTQVSAASGIDLDTFYDNFNDNSIDASLWGTGSFPGSDALVTVNEVNGQLVITPRAGQTGLHYNGLISNRTYNLTQGIIFVEVVEVTRSQADTTFAFGADNNNKVVMEVENVSLNMRLVVGGSNVGAIAIPYDTVSHRWWRISHVAGNDTIRFDTSPDGIAWTQRHSIARGALNITAGKVNLSAGTWNSQSSPGRAVFDNLSWHPLVPNKGDWSAEATALSPNPTPGTW